MWFTVDTDRTVKEKLQKIMTGQFAEEDLRNMKHRPKARERQREACEHWIERDRRG